MSIIWKVRAVPWMYLSGWCFLRCVLVCMYVSKCITLVGSRRFGLMDGTDWTRLERVQARYVDGREKPEGEARGTKKQKWIEFGLMM